VETPGGPPRIAARSGPSAAPGGRSASAFATGGGEIPSRAASCSGADWRSSGSDRAGAAPGRATQTRAPGFRRAARAKRTVPIDWQGEGRRHGRVEGRRHGLDNSGHRAALLVSAAAGSRVSARRQRQRRCGHGGLRSGGEMRGRRTTGVAIARPVASSMLPTGTDTRRRRANSGTSGRGTHRGLDSHGCSGAGTGSGDVDAARVRGVASPRASSAVRAVRASGSGDPGRLRSRWWRRQLRSAWRRAWSSIDRL
jgi:hypothetical protein